MTAKGTRICLTILGAGMARRFGGDKLSAPCAGKPLGRWAVERALSLQQDLGCPAPLCITDQPEACWTGPHVRTVINMEPERGLSSSLHHAVTVAALDGATHLLVMLADMPLVSRVTLQTLIDAAQRTGYAAAIRHAGDRPGVPACFPAQDFDALRALTGDQGAGALLRTMPRLSLIDVAEAERLDVDTTESLAKAAASLSMPQDAADL